MEDVMGKVTFVVDFEDGSEPVVHGNMPVLGGRLSAVLWSDYRDDFLKQEETDIVREALDELSCDDADADLHAEIMQKIDLMTM
jgi:hypothetical protein